MAGWLDRGGVYAVANIRGGSEYGEEWHRAGTRERKQNVFDDFIAAAEYLIREKYTTTVPSSRSRAARTADCWSRRRMTQRPDLFAVALPEVGVLDMMRYQKFSAGPFWADDYGSSDEPEAAKYLLGLFAAATTSRRAPVTRQRSSPPPIATTAWCPAIPSSSPRHCRPHRPARGRS